LKEAGATPETSLFIDDLAENLETPAKAGWRTLHLPPGTDLEKELLTFQISGIKKA
jgi:FMN phosphatase YigB (HAD superfamily)